MPGPHSARSVVVPFPAHQVLEYLGGLYLLQAGTKVHGRATTVFFVAGLVVLAAATLSGKPFGGGRLARPLHRVVDIAIIVGLAAAPFVFGLTGEASVVVRLEGLAAIFVALAWFTNYARPRPRGQGQTAQTARAIKEHGPRAAGLMIGRRLAAKRKPPGST